MKVKDICKVQYLSCVEAYFGAWFRDYVELPALYCESYLSWHEIAGAFSNSTVNYANFSLIPRLQELAERVGLVTHCKENGFPVKRGKGELVLLSVKENFFTKQKPWRSDHYIALEKCTAKKIYYLNEYPLEEGETPFAEFSDKFGGTCLIYRATGNDGQAGLLWQSKTQAERLSGDKLSEPPQIISVKRLRDAVGILRVSRRRTMEWLTWYAKNRYIADAERLRKRLTEQISYADKCYFLLQKMMIRCERDEKILRGITLRLQDLEPNIGERE